MLAIFILCFRTPSCLENGSSWHLGTLRHISFFQISLLLIFLSDFFQIVLFSFHTFSAKEQMSLFLLFRTSGRNIPCIQDIYKTSTSAFKSCKDCKYSYTYNHCSYSNLPESLCINLDWIIANTLTVTTNVCPASSTLTILSK